MEELTDFIQSWKDTDSGTKQAFVAIKDHIMAMAGVSVAFNARPGVSYSLRPRHDHQSGRNLFAMADVIDDDPDERWLSICFYGDMISDPDGMGDLIPEGLLGEDGYCFDLYAYDEDEVAYLIQRLDEAHRAASKV